MKIAIIGAGITGLTAAYRLSQKSHQVTIFEKEKYAGGLAAGFKEKNWDWNLEYFFHHLFISDQMAKNLITELDLSQKLFYHRPKTSIFFNKKVSRFDSPLSALRFPHLAFNQRLRVGLVTAYLKFTNDWKKFEEVTANDWLEKHYGQMPHQILWKPLLEAKFGQEAQKISMSWFWARIKKRSPNLGYIEGGFQVLIDKLIEKIKEKGGEIFLNCEVKNLSDIYHRSKFDRIIATTPTSVFLKIASNLPVNYTKKLKRLRIIGAISLVLKVKQKFLKDGTYWLNINEPSFPFVAVVEHTNFVDPKYYGGSHILYVGGYYPQSHQIFKMNKRQIFNLFLPYLKKINPTYHLSPITYHLFKNPLAQPIISINYSQFLFSYQTPISNVFLANMQQIYPWDRGVNYAIELGERVANEVLKDI